MKLAIWSDVDALESVIQSEVGQEEKNKYHALTRVCGIVLMNLFAEQKWRERHREKCKDTKEGRGVVG